MQLKRYGGLHKHWRLIAVARISFMTFGILMFSLLPTTATSNGSQVIGYVTHVRDVDTIEVGNVAIRLNGLDGPELSTNIGQQAKRFMTELVLNRQVTCELTGERSYDRQIGVCFLNGEDIGAIAVSNGYALDCRRYSGGRYAHLEVVSAVFAITRAGYCE